MAKCKPKIYQDYVKQCQNFPISKSQIIKKKELVQGFSSTDRNNNIPRSDHKYNIAKQQLQQSGQYPETKIACNTTREAFSENKGKIDVEKISNILQNKIKTHYHSFRYTSNPQQKTENE